MKHRNVPEVKICGITTQEDVEILNKVLPEYAGFVVFYPKSKRFITLEQAAVLMEKLDRHIKRVAVVVSPTEEQVAEIERTGFDVLQVHGKLTEDVLQLTKLPVFRAWNVEEDKRVESYEQEELEQDRVKAYVLDGKTPGGGETFDWSIVERFERKGKKLMLAGGLNTGNAAEAVRQVKPDIVDVSSGVEKKGGGKDAERVKEFIEAVRQNVV